MKYQFIKVDEDTTKLKYKDKEFEIKRNVKLVSEIQALVMKARVKMIQDFAKQGISVKDLTIETKKDGKTYYDNSNKAELEKIYQEQVTLEYFNNKYQELFGMDMVELLQDIGLEKEDEVSKFSEELVQHLNGIIPR
jgi:hypothetical protein